VQKLDLRFYEAELHRIKGELLLAQEGKSEKAKGKTEEVSEAEACFQKAFDIAQSQRAKTLELRAVMSLSRLWQKQGKKQEAHQLLAEVYGWFTEGFDTADLNEAKAMLEELS
jgi:predicted ATPase